MQKQKIVSLLIVLLLVAFIAPQIALAVWWNPFSWGIWNRIFNKQTPTTEQIQKSEKPVDQTTGTTPSETEGWKTYKISRCGLTLTEKSGKVSKVMNFPNENGNGETLQIYITGKTKPVLVLSCQKKIDDAQAVAQGYSNNISKLLGIMSSGSNLVNKSGYLVFDNKTVSSINQLYSAKDKFPNEGSEAIGFEDKNWMYMFTFLNPEQNKNQNNFIISIDQTADWKTYTNTQYGYEIKYPKDWSINTSSGVLNIFCNFQNGDKKCEGLENVGIGVPGPGIGITVKQINFEDFTKDYVVNGKENYLLDGTTGWKFSGGPVVSVGSSDYIFAKRNNNTYIITYVSMASIQDQIISTFKFTK